ncbi:MAG: exodeoxyribonuclease III [Pirellulales bacterium]|nr:exodeoxyribonuclease III [Pirellulales bacterium]
MRITTWNVNGLRAALRKGFAEELASIRPDILLLQEVRAMPEQLPKPWAEPEGWVVHWNPAQKKGYAGTAVWTRQRSQLLHTGLGPTDPDPEGRLTLVRVGKLHVASAYLPSGSSSPERQVEKERWMRRFRPWATRQLKRTGPSILGGDLNIAHTEQDIFYAQGNSQNSGFLPHERQWFGRLLKSGWHDLVRQDVGDIDGPYSWWSNRGRARELDRGWRIDYMLANSAARLQFCHSRTHRQAGLAVSDHAPVTIELNM